MQKIFFLDRYSRISLVEYFLLSQLLSSQMDFILIDYLIQNPECNGRKGIYAQALYVSTTRKRGMK